MKVESTGLACWAWDGGALRADEMKEDEEPDRQDEAMVLSGRPAAGPLVVVRVPLEVLLGTPPFRASCCVTGTRRAAERLSGGGQGSSRRPSH